MLNFEQYWKSRGWKDLIFLAVLFVLGLAAKQYMYEPTLTDYLRWQRRPSLDFNSLSKAQSLTLPDSGRNGLPPCLFIAPSKDAESPHPTGTIADCLLLIPNGEKLNLFEINLTTGLFIPVRTDAYIQDSPPVAFTRTYFPPDKWARRFQVYLPNVYDIFLTGSRNPCTYEDWQLPDRQVIDYSRISSGKGYKDAVFESSRIIPTFLFSRVDWNGWGWDLSLLDGTTLLSPEAYNSTRPQQGAIVGVFDKDGHEVLVSRETNGDLASITAPGGRKLQILYDRDRLSQILDPSGHSVTYVYDGLDRLITVELPGGETTNYDYDDTNQIVSVDDEPESLHLKNRYNSHGVLIETSMGSGIDYSFSPARDSNQQAHVTISAPGKRALIVTMRTEDENIYYSVSQTASN
jgi:YD repeat-containing protein